MRRSRWFASLAVAAGLSLLAAACGDDDGTATEGTTAPAGDGGATTTEGDATATTEAGGTTDNADFKACQVTDEGGIDDGSFNQTAYSGLEQAEEELGIEQTYIESETAEDFEPNIQAMLDEECDIIVTIGFALGDATATAAEANPDTEFAIVDVDFFDFDANADVTFDNVRELTFRTDEAAFLAGYLAAGMSETGVVGTYGGRNIPPVTIFMDGFLQGIEQFNEDEGTAVTLLGWDGTDGLFTDDFTDATKGRDLTEQLLDQNADIVMPVAGPVGAGTIEAIQAAGGGQRVIWVDADGCEQDPDNCPLFLTSVLKNMDVPVLETITAAVNDEFANDLYVGTLANGGVGIAPFHEQEGDVPPELAARIEELQQQIIDGDITIGG